MRVEEIGRIDALPTDLGVKIESAGGETTRLQNFVNRQSDFLDAVGELIGIPTDLPIAAIGIDAAEDAQCGRRGGLMLEAVTGQGRVIGLDIDLYLILQTELLAAIRRCSSRRLSRIT